MRAISVILVMLSALFALSAQQGPSTTNTPGKATDPSDRLILLQVLSRHTDRASQSDDYITPMADAEFFRGKGELSTEGILHAQKIGQDYRQYYISEAGFFDSRQNPAQVYFQSSSVNRVLQTASSFSTGLFSDKSSPIPAPIITIPYQNDDLLAIQYNCLNGWSDITTFYELNNTSNMANVLLEKMRETEWTCLDPKSDRSDTLLSEFANSVTTANLTEAQKVCAQGDARTFMYSYLERLGGSGEEWESSKERMQRSCGNLANLLISNFKEKINCNSSNQVCQEKKANFFFSHDVNQICLMNVLSYMKGSRDYFKGMNPSFGSSLAVELWSREETKYFVKMYVRDGFGKTTPFEWFDFCSHLPPNKKFERIGGYCSLDELAENVGNFVSTEQTTCVLSSKESCCPQGIWSEWSERDECAEQCGSCISAKRTRVCESLKTGCPCVGEASDKGPCGTKPCKSLQTMHPFKFWCCGNYSIQYNFNSDRFFCGMGSVMPSPEECTKLPM